MKAAENVVITFPTKTRLVCSDCGAPGEGSCRCGAPYVSPGVRAEAAVKATPDDSDRTIADRIGVDQKTVFRARKKLGEAHASTEKRKGKDGKTYTAKRKRRTKKTDPVKDKIADLVNQGLTSPVIAATVGVEGRAVRHVIEHEEIREAARQEAFAEIVGTKEFTKATAAQKLEAFKRMVERELNAKHAERMRGLDEEVRLRVVAKNKEYLAKLNAMEEKARETVELYQKFTNNHKALFTIEQFKTILMCLHPDGQRTEEKLSSAFRLFNAKKLQLTGEG
jgi:transposase-like protein